MDLVTKISPLGFERSHPKSSLSTKVWKLESWKGRLIDAVEPKWGCCTKRLWPSWAINEAEGYDPTGFTRFVGLAA